MTRNEAIEKVVLANRQPSPEVLTLAGQGAHRVIAALEALGLVKFDAEPLSVQEVLAEVRLGPVGCPAYVVGSGPDDARRITEALAVNGYEVVRKPRTGAQVSAAMSSYAEAARGQQAGVPIDQATSNVRYSFEDVLAATRLGPSCPLGSQTQWKVGHGPDGAARIIHRLKTHGYKIVKDTP